MGKPDPRVTRSKRYSQHQRSKALLKAGCWRRSCGFCGLEGCLTQLQEKKKGSLSVASNCPYHYAAMNYKAAAKFSNTIPCTNVPVHCPICPTSVSRQPQTIWKYNAMYHLIHEHSIGDTSLPIPGQFLVQIFITKEEERALGILEQATTR